MAYWAGHSLGRGLLMDMGRPGNRGCTLPRLDVPPAALPEARLLRSDLPLPEVTEGELVRYFNALSQLNFGVDSGFYPLGSCTMKYNPKWHEEAARLPGLASLHPLQPLETVQGALRLMFELQGYLAEITGMAATSLAPMAGAQGELTSILMIRAYHRERGDKGRHTVLVPDSAHGTNAATAAMGGFGTATLRSDPQGNVDMSSLEEAMTGQVAALMLTLPSTLGLFDSNILEIAQLVHRRGGLLYGDGANLNALMGQVKLGELGFDAVHLNLHKTFSTPHGGGGPGAGPICVSQALAPYLPSPVVEREGETYRLVTPPRSIGRMGAFHGNFGVLVRAYAYIRSLGAGGLKEVSTNAVVNANYLRSRLQDTYHLPYDRPCLHEVVFSALRQRNQGVRAMDIAKRLIDYGFHPPTIYFPTIVPEALMIEPTETESKDTLDAFVEAMKSISREVAETPQLVKSAPQRGRFARLDEATAARRPVLRWQPPQPGETP